MKRVIVLLFVSVFLSCNTGTNNVETVDTLVDDNAQDIPVINPGDKSPTTTIGSRPVWVMNANWEIVRTNSVKSNFRSISEREIDTLEALNEEIAIHNLAFPENPWTAYIDTVPNIEDAPMCELWIADQITNEIKTNPSTGILYHHLFARVDVVPRRWAWEMDAANVGGKLYLDYPPPPVVAPPPPPTDEELYALYSIYAVGSTGLIHYQIHITEEDWKTQGYTSRDNMFGQKLAYFDAICVGDGVGKVDSPWHVVSRIVYTEPE